MSTESLISVIVPVYNVAPYLRRCLDTIINQTYKNLEIIIVASTSTDDSVEICEEYAKKDSRITLIHSEPKGLSDARNRGIEAAHGEYLSFIDSDDYIHPDFISTLYRICSENNCEIAQCGLIRVDTEYNEILFEPEREINIYSGREMSYNFYYGFPNGTANVVTWSKLYRRHLFSKLRFPVGKIHEDVATTHQLFYTAERIGVTTQPLYFYRRVPTSIMGVGFTLKRLDGLQFFEERAEFFKEKGEDELSSLWHLQYVKSYKAYLKNLKKYYPKEVELRKNLQHKCKKELLKVLNNPQIPIIEKVITISGFYLPRIITTLGKLIPINKIRRFIFLKNQK